VSGEVDTSVVVTNLLPDLHSDSLAELNFRSQADPVQWADKAAL
jgi:hypothetical protein